MWKSWNRLWPFVTPYKLQIFGALFLGFFYAQLQVLLPVLVQILISALERLGDASDSSALISMAQDQIQKKNDMQWLMDWLPLSTDHWMFHLSDKDIVRAVALSFPIYYLFLGIVRYFHFFWVKYIGEKIISDVRLALMNKFMDLDVLYTSRSEKGSGGLLSRTLNDTMVLQNGLQYYGDLIREPIVGLFMVAYLFYNNWKMTLGCIVFLPIFAAVIRYVSKSLRKFGHQSQESLEEVTKTLKESLDGVRVIQSFNLQGTIKEKFRNQVNDFLNKRRKIIKREELGSPINEWFASILVSAICLFQIQMISLGESDLASFLGFIFAAGLLDKPVKKTQQAVICIQQNVVALERLNEVLTSESHIEEPRTPVPVPKNWQEIRFEHVNFGFHEKDILKDINLTIKKGEVIALVGESGSGKSTLAGLLQRFFDPQSGEITIGGQKIRDFKTSDLRDQIGYVTQDVFLFDDSIETNVRYGQLSRDPKDVSAAIQMANATEFVGSKPEGLHTRVGDRGTRLSGGERQRISIARAVFKDPPILILDEATSALDSASEKEVQKGIDSLLQGRTALVIAHRLSTIINSDRIVVMKSGQIVEQGTHEELLKKAGEYSRFYKLQYE